MKYVRYSAIEMFGAPIDNVDQSKNATELVYGLMDAYGVEPTEIPTEPTDISPPYWTKHHFSYFVHLGHPEGPAIMEMLPRYDDAQNYHVDAIPGVAVAGIRKIEIPTDQEVAAIIGPSPRFGGQLCVHEVIGVRDI